MFGAKFLDGQSGQSAFGIEESFTGSHL